MKKTKLISIDRRNVILASLTDVLNIPDRVEAVYEHGKLLSIIIVEHIDGDNYTPSYELKSWLLNKTIVQDFESELWDIEKLDALTPDSDEDYDKFKDSQAESEVSNG